MTDQMTSIILSLTRVLLFLQYMHGTAFQSTNAPSRHRYSNPHQLLMTTSTATESNICEDQAAPPGSLKLLCTTSLEACVILTPLITTIYNDLSTAEVKTKQDNSAFTIADGLVQRLIYVLFDSVNFRGIVGEEDVSTTTSSEEDESWDVIDGLPIPTTIIPLVHSTKSKIEALATSITGDYSQITVFVDPIDGTREFTSGKGEQCSICIGFSNMEGYAVGGVVYRPLTNNPTWAAGVKSEGYSKHNLDSSENENNADYGGLLTSNGSISPFIHSLMEELDMKRLKAGGAGNKMLLLLERSLISNEKDRMNSMLYIQDRGVSRWDTCAAEAVLEAFGGKILKLTHVQQKIHDASEGRYKYLESETNLDFIPGMARLTKYNCKNNDRIQPNQMIDDIGQVKPYSNLCGLVALGKEWNTVEGLKLITEAVLKAAEKDSPSYD